MAKLEDARQEGFMEGFIKSFEQTSGKHLKSCSKQDKIRIANTLLDNHILIEVISKYTGLSFEEVNNLHRKKILRNLDISDITNLSKEKAKERNNEILITLKTQCLNSIIQVIYHIILAILIH